MGKKRDSINAELCGAKSRTTGKPCRHIAGFRTEHVGTGNCWLHGGRTSTHNKHAIAVEVERRMATYGEPIEDIDAPRALLGLLRATAGHVEYLRVRMGELDELSSREAAVTTRLYREEREMLRRIGESCSKAGVDAAIIRVEEAKAVQMMTTIEAVLRELRLTDGQRRALGPALRKHAALMRGDEPEPGSDQRIRDALAIDYPPDEFVS